jgi:outer membrane receptor for ferrienterochelin and colicins
MRKFAPVLLFTLAASGSALRAQSVPDELSDMSLEELLDQPVVTASNKPERRLVAPATVVVLTGQEIRERGYADLSGIFDDLPGMDVVRPYGATYLKNYWRGYRNTIGDPFLLLVDGVVMNHLYFNTADLIAAMPLSNIERVEVVYGPASSVYGANAFMGVVNIITMQPEPNGSSGVATLSGGSFGGRSADAAYSFAAGDITFRVAGRFDNGELDPSIGDRYEYTNRRYYQDRTLWGGFLDNAAIAGDFRSERRHRAVDLRASVGALELGVNYFVLDSGYGLEYAGDRAQNDAIWKRPELGIFARLERALSEDLSSRTLLRYRESDVSSDSFFVAGGEAGGDRLIDFSYWQSQNSSWSLLQDFEWSVNPRLSMSAGFKYERKDLQKAYDVSYGPSLAPEDVDAASYPYPLPPSTGRIAHNRTTTEDEGVYLQGWYELTPRQRLNVGVRWDDNSQYGDGTTLRAGYVATVNRWTVKALYGEAFQEPVPRLLYGGWTGSGSDPDLVPEKSTTFETSAGYSRGDFSTLLSLYQVENEKTIVNSAAGAENIGTRSVGGLDLHLQYVVRPTTNSRLKSWLYVSHLLEAEEEVEGERIGAQSIGDLAEHKIMFGTTWRWRRDYSATLRGRWIGDRDTTPTNPVRSVDDYTTVDAAFSVDRLMSLPLGLQVSVQNLTDAEYFHPGVREADAGTDPGVMNADGSWQGSDGFFSSLLPQPGRSVVVSLRLGI